jgi:integrase
MTQAPASIFKIPTESPQPAPGKAAKPSRAKKAPHVSRSPVLASGNGRAATRGNGEVIELECGITVYPARSEGGRWRAVWYEDGQRQQCEAATGDKLMASTAAYSGLRWGELTALTIPQVDQDARVITVDRKVVEVAGYLFLEAPKNRKHRKTIYPRRAPAGYPLAERLAARIEQARAEQEAGTNPLGLIFPSPKGKYWRSSNFSRNVLKRAYLAVGWRDADSNGAWTWHSLRHVFCTTALFTWKLDPTDVSRMAGHANYRITLDMYVNSQELHQAGEKLQVA